MKRQPDETMEAYIKRRKQSQIAIKNKLKGNRIETSYGMPYKKPKDIERQTITKALRTAKGYASHLAQKPLGI